MIRVKFTNETHYRNVAFTRVTDHIVTLKGDAHILNTLNTAGFYTYRASEDVLLGDFTKYTTVYRVTDEYIQYSDDGSKWEVPPEPTHGVTLSVQWDDAGNVDGTRPDSVQIVVNGKEEITITAEDTWNVTLPAVPISETITITDATPVEEYTVMCCGHTVVYRRDYINPEPSLEERITDAEDAIIELYDLILTMEEEE